MRPLYRFRKLVVANFILMISYFFPNVNFFLYKKAEPPYKKRFRFPQANVPVIVSTDVPGVTVTIPVAESVVTVAAGTVILPATDVNTPFAV